MAPRGSRASNASVDHTEVGYDVSRRVIEVDGRHRLGRVAWVYTRPVSGSSAESRGKSRARADRGNSGGRGSMETVRDDEVTESPGRCGRATARGGFQRSSSNRKRQPGGGPLWGDPRPDWVKSIPRGLLDHRGPQRHLEGREHGKQSPQSSLRFGVRASRINPARGRRDGHRNQVVVAAEAVKGFECRN